MRTSPHLLQTLTALNKSKDGLSNSEIDDLTSDNGNWMTLWVLRQLTSLGFVQYKVDFFGGPARYGITDLGRSVLALATGQPLPQSSPTPPPVQTSVPKT